MKNSITPFIGLMGSAIFLVGSISSLISNLHQSSYWGTAGALALTAIFYGLACITLILAKKYGQSDSEKMRKLIKQSAHRTMDNPHPIPQHTPGHQHSVEAMKT